MQGLVPMCWVITNKSFIHPFPPGLDFRSFPTPLCLSLLTSQFLGSLFSVYNYKEHSQTIYAEIFVRLLPGDLGGMTFPESPTAWWLIIWMTLTNETEIEVSVPLPWRVTSYPDCPRTEEFPRYGTFCFKTNNSSREESGQIHHLMSWPRP